MSHAEALDHLRAGRPRAAAALLEAHLGLQYTDARGWFLLAACRHELNDLDGAETAFVRSLALDPADDEAHLAYVSVLRAAGKARAALAAAQKAAMRFPGDARFQYATALSLEDLGESEQALAQYDSALAVDPELEDVLHNRGLLLARLGRMVEAEADHRRAIAAHPVSARAHSALADVLLAQDRYSEAIESAQRAIEISPQAMHGALIAGLACAMLEQFAESEAWLQRARAMDSVRFDRLLAERLAGGNVERDLDPRAIRLIRGFNRLESCDWRDYEHYVALFNKLIASGIRDGKPIASPPLVFRSLAIPMLPEHRRQLADSVARHFVAAARPWRRSATHDGRIRLGYVSPDFGTHPTGILSAPLFSLHDRSRFDVHAFSLSPDDGSEWRRRVERDADCFHQMHGLPFLEVQRRVRDAGIDLLVDLAGHTTGALPELFGERAAPIQASYLGFPGTSGAGFVDYLICDTTCVPPDEESAYGESLVRLPDTFWIYELGAPPRTIPNRSNVALPDDAFVYYAHHPGQKITPGVFSIWMKILTAIPHGVLWLLDDHPDMTINLRREAKVRGVSPNRLVFAPRVSHAEYRARIALADLALDTPIYNGGATTLDALACGVPVLSCPGTGFAGRMAASALHAAGLGELIMADLESYTAKAISLAREMDGVASVRQRVQNARRDSKLFDVGGRVRQLEAAYLQMITRNASPKD